MVVPCDDLTEATAGYERVGFDLVATGPADEPTWAELDLITPHGGLRIRLDTSAPFGPKPSLRVPGAPPSTVPGPPGLTFVDTGPRLDPPSRQARAVSGPADGDWVTGRAGMRYRDLIPDRHGGAYIASHIHIPHGGPVPDRVHHHDIGFQAIFCHRGWVRVQYQDQGPSFVMQPGDLVLQPPGIRHRVLGASDDLYVFEIASPASHRTWFEYDQVLPGLRPGRRYGGQRFVHHRSSLRPWTTAEPGWLAQLTDVAAATDDAGRVRLLKPSGEAAPVTLAHDDDLRLQFIVAGSARLEGSTSGTAAVELRAGACVTVEPGNDLSLAAASDDLVVLEIRHRQPGTGVS